MENQETKLIPGPPLAPLFAALSKAQSEFPEIKKTKNARIPMKKGGVYSYKYADLADIRKSVQPSLSKNGICIIQLIQGNELVSMLCHSSGASVKSKMALNIGSCSPQELGSLLTYYRRYALCGLLGIAADEDEDGKAAQDSYKANNNTVRQTAPQARQRAPQSHTTNVPVQQRRAPVQPPATAPTEFENAPNTGNPFDRYRTPPNQRGK